MADEQQIVLEKPVEFAGATITVLNVREPTVAEWEKFDGLTGVASNVKALSIVCGVPEGALKLMGVRDFRRAAAVLDGFFAQPETTAA